MVFEAWVVRCSPNSRFGSCSEKFGNCWCKTCQKLRVILDT